MALLIWTPFMLLLLHLIASELQSTRTAVHLFCNIHLSVCCIDEFVQGSGGLSVELARERLELLGPNEIPFRAEPFWFTVYDEVFTLFHAYQAIMYAEWLWFAYLFVAAVLITVVVLSACVTICSRRRSQLAIAKVVFTVACTKWLVSDCSN
jgi:hypothetical protein